MIHLAVWGAKVPLAHTGEAEHVHRPGGRHHLALEGHRPLRRVLRLVECHHEAAIAVALHRPHAVERPHRLQGDVVRVADDVLGEAARRVKQVDVDCGTMSCLPASLLVWLCLNCLLCFYFCFS